MIFLIHFILGLMIKYVNICFYFFFFSSNLVGHLNVDEKALSFDELDAKFANELRKNSGGHWKPQNCKSHSKVAIIVPYRNREHHLRVFLNFMHAFLSKQLIDYSIYIIEEARLENS